VPQDKHCAGNGCSVGGPVAGGQINTYNSIQCIRTLAGLDDSCPAREAIQLHLIHLEREREEQKGGEKEGEEEGMWEDVRVKECMRRWKLIN
jgi:hypothetical protein